MSELMIPIPFKELMNWLTTEYDREGSVFEIGRAACRERELMPV